jgi:hypothetical protein
MLIKSTQRRQPIKQTPYQKVKNSTIGRLVRDNKVGTGASVVAATAVIGGGVLQSDAFSQVARYGIAPAVGAGVSALGAAAVHDAVVNDVGENNLLATAKIAGGTTAALGGAQVVGLAFDIPVLDQALTGVVFDHGESVLGGALLTGAAFAGKAAAGQFTKMGEADSNKAVHGALGTGAIVGSAAAGLAGIELVGRDLNIPGADRAFTGTLEFLTKTSAASVVGGGLLVGGALVAGGQAGKNLVSGDGNDYATAAMASGAVAGGLGGVEILGHGLGLEATRGLFTEHAGAVGGLSVSAFGGAIANHAAKSIQKNGATPFNTLALTTGVAAIGGGASLAAVALNASAATEFIGNGTSVLAGAGLGMSSYAFGKQAIKATKEGKIGTALFHGAGAATTAAGGLFAVGRGLGIEALEQAGEKIIDVTVRPLAEHVIGPSLEFLFENPVLGGLGLAAVVGSFAYAQMNKE